MANNELATDTKKLAETLINVNWGGAKYAL